MTAFVPHFHTRALPGPAKTAAPSRRSLLRAALGGVAASCVAPAAFGASLGTSLGADNKALNSVARAARQAVQAGLPGVAMGWVPGKASTVLATAGVRRLGEPGAIHANSHFYIGSNTKAMTAMVLARVVEQGHLNWDTRITQAVPALASILRADYAQVTLAQLLDHKGGVLAFNGSTGEENRFLADLLSDPRPLPASLHGRRRYAAAWALRQTPPSGVRPGLDYHYSNMGYLIAALMAETQTGQPFETLFDSLLATPLGLEGDWRRPSQRGSAYPQGHSGPLGSLVAVSPDEPLIEQWTQALAPAGFRACPPASYARWLAAVQAALRGETSLLPADAVARLRSLSADDYALGWGCVEGASGQRLLAHAGEYEGFSTLAALDQTGAWGLFASTNALYNDPVTGDSWVLNQLNASLLQVLSNPPGLG